MRGRPKAIITGFGREPPVDQALTGDDTKDDTSQITNQLNLFAY
jgi:hypothetical protein